VVDAEEELPFAKVHQQRHQIVAPLLKLDVLALMEVVHADVDFRTTGHPARQLLAQEEIRVPPQPLRPLDRIVIGQGEQVHAAPLELGENLVRIAVTFPTELADKGGSAGP
jgi:hypothetical protein